MNAWRSPFLSLRWRLAVVAMVVMAGGGWWMASLAADQLHRNYQEAMEETLVDSAHILAALIAEESNAGVVSSRGITAAMEAAGRLKLSARIYGHEKTHVSTAVQVTDATGVVLYDSDEPNNSGRDFSRWNDIARTLQGRYGARATRSDPNDRSTAVLHIAAPIQREGKIIGVVSVSKGVDSVSPFMEAARQGMLRAGIVAGLAAALVALAATVWITRPLARLVRWAEAVKAGGRPPVPRVGGGEVGRLGEAITGLQASLDGRTYVEGYVQHLTHELKSPLAGIRGASELLSEDLPPEMRRRFLANITAESARVQDLIDRLLQLAGLEKRERAVSAEDIPLAALMREVTDDFAPQAAQAQVAIAVDAEVGLVVRGERFLVRQALGNLVANAIDFAPAGSVVTISARGQNGKAVLTVRDRGPGIPPWAQERLFERFYSLPRPQTGRKGTGLGLSFVHEIADLHGGSVTLTNHPDGGALAELHLPGMYVHTGT